MNVEKGFQDGWTLTADQPRLPLKSWVLDRTQLARRRIFAWESTPVVVVPPLSLSALLARGTLLDPESYTFSELNEDSEGSSWVRLTKLEVGAAENGWTEREVFSNEIHQ